jgi:hypothetical protein
MQRNRKFWTIDFGPHMELNEAKLYLAPFEYINNTVYPERVNNRRKAYREKWWLYQEPRVELREKLSSLARYIVTPRVAKHRVFIWVNKEILANDANIVIARDDDYFFGVLHSHVHELWSLRLGTSLEDRPRYTPTTSFETFPFPWPPGHEPKDDPKVQAIAAHAKALDDFRTGWLKSIEGQVGVTISEKVANRYTLTNLYNALTLYREKHRGRQRDPRLWAGGPHGDIISLEQIETLDHIHARLDQAVLDAYGWPHNLNDDGILEKLLALNLERAGKT